ncbi:MAG: hypothetical protein EOP56_09385 [Sphingobacteriales bacterium]|nr:MAG: hypothetical protein EOP56_09385 [Sphingobacteriales bacterium]
MARTIADIQNQIIANVEADSDLSGVNSPSKRALWRLWTYIVATAISVFEQILDIARADIEATVAAAPPATAAWVQQRMFEFQYDATTPQYVQLVDLVPQYTTVDESLRIITRCSVTKGFYNNVNIKLAKGDTPEPLTTDEKNAAQDYINTIGIAGINYLVNSTDSDKLYIAADIYYKGSFSSTIATTVIAAIDSYLAAIPFDGIVKLVDLLDVMKSVTGVNDVVLKSVGAREDSVAFANKTLLINNNTWQLTQWQTVSGYIIGETTSGQTFLDKLNFIPQ